MRLIDADTLKDMIRSVVDGPWDLWPLNIIDNAPIVEQQTGEPRIGAWIETNGHYDCSLCGVSWDLNEGTPWDNELYYCPKCGSKMSNVIQLRYDEDEDGEEDD